MCLALVEVCRVTDGTGEVFSQYLGSFFLTYGLAQGPKNDIMVVVVLEPSTVVLTNANHAI